jgi:hypothetical protein
MLAFNVYVSILLIAGSAAPQSHTRDVSKAARMLRRALPHGVEWRYSQHLDISGDGKPDEVFTSHDRIRFYVGVVLGPISPSSPVSIVSFARETSSLSSQDSFCGPFESLAPEALANREELIEMLTAAPPGYLHGTRAAGLRLVAGQCDDFHLFWNSSSKQLDWWRL